MLTSPPPLDPYIGKTISQLCPFSMAKDNAQNHCAHFVGHIMEYENFTYTCKNNTLADKQAPGKGAVIRVDDIFNASPQTGPWAKRPPALTSCLIFVTVSSNIDPSGPRLRMRSAAKKHIGFYRDGSVWHYGNSQDKVVKDSRILFTQKFVHAYSTAGQTVEFFYGRYLK